MPQGGVGDMGKISNTYLSMTIPVVSEMRCQ